MNLSRPLTFKNSPTLSRFLGAIVLLAGVATPLHASQLSGNYDGVGTLTPTGMPGIFIQDLTGDGVDAFFGAFTIGGESTVDFNNPPHIAVSGGQGHG